MIILDYILIITGFCMLVISIITLFVKDKSYDSNIKIIDSPTDDDLKICKTFIEHRDIENQTIEKILFLPINIDVKCLKIYSIKYEGNRIKKEEIKILKNITPYNGHILYLSRGCGIPLYLLEWYVDYGAKAEYIVSMNGQTGNNNELVIKYTFGIIQKLRKALHIR